MMAEIIVVPHTHWDREWYEPLQGFRNADELIGLPRLEVGVQSDELAEGAARLSLWGSRGEGYPHFTAMDQRPLGGTEGGRHCACRSP